jgi:hypothetical protein
MIPTHLGVSDSDEDVIKELLYLLVEERGGMDGQLTQNQNLQCTVYMWNEQCVPISWKILQQYA